MFFCVIWPLVYARAGTCVKPLYGVYADNSYCNSTWLACWIYGHGKFRILPTFAVGFILINPTANPKSHGQKKQNPRANPPSHAKVLKYIQLFHDIFKKNPTLSHATRTPSLVGKGVDSTRFPQQGCTLNVPVHVHRSKRSNRSNVHDFFNERSYERFYKSSWKWINIHEKISRPGASQVAAVVPKVVWVALVKNLRVAKFFSKLHKMIYMIQRIML